MALTLTVELDAAHDAISELAEVHERLGRRHGARFRNLERRIDRIVDGEIPITCGSIEQLSGGVFIVAAPPEVSALLREARDLGVI